MTHDKTWTRVSTAFIDIFIYAFKLYNCYWITTKYCLFFIFLIQSLICAYLWVPLQSFRAENSIQWISKWQSSFHSNRTAPMSHSKWNLYSQQTKEIIYSHKLPNDLVFFRWNNLILNECSWLKRCRKQYHWRSKYFDNEHPSACRSN